MRRATFAFIAALLSACQNGRPGSPNDLSAVVDDGVEFAADLGDDASLAISDRIETFTGADGNPVTVTVHAPSVVNQVVIDLPSGATDYDRFVSAIAAAKMSGGPTLLSIPSGNYDIDLPEVDGSVASEHVLFSGLNDVVIDGHGASLTFHHVGAKGIIVNHSNRLLFRNFSVDWAQPLAVPGQITQGTLDGGVATYFDVDAAYPITADTIFPISNMMQFNTTARNFVVPTPFVDTNWAASQSGGTPPVYLSGQRFLLPSPNGFQNLATGTRVVASGRNVDAIEVSTGTNDIAFENVTVYQALGIGIHFFGNPGRGFRLSNCNVVRNEAATPPRMYSTNADAFHFSATQGDIIVENSEVGYNGDDGVSMFGAPIAITTVTAANVITIPAASSSLLSIGDPVRVIDTGTFALAAETTVASVQTNCSTCAIALTSAALTISSTPNLQLEIMNRANARAIVRGNFLHDKRARGIAISTGQALVELNHTQNTAEAGIFLDASDTAFADGPGALDVIVRNNTIDTADENVKAADSSCASGRLYGALTIGSVITTMGSTVPSMANGFPHGTIVVSGNTINNSPYLAMAVASATGVTVSNNQVTSANLLTFDHSGCATFPSAGMPYIAGSIMAFDAKQVTFSGNTRSGGSAGLVVDSTCVMCTSQPGY